MAVKKVLFVFRKPNKGNFSIEKVYQSILSQLIKISGYDFEYKKMTLKHNYDFFSFLSCFVSSLVTKKCIVHITGGCNYMMLAFPFKKRVLTIHDLYHYRRFKGLKGVVYNLFFYQLPIIFSHKIIAVSEKTKKELLQHFKNSDEKTEVIENPLTVATEHIIQRERSFSKNQTMQVLQIGDKPLKNYQRLIEATKNMNVYYHFVHSQTETIQSLILQHGIENKSKVYSGLNDENLYKLYNKADVLFFASEEEGFGLPLIEAKVFGVIVVTSNFPPMNQVGKGAIFVNPYSVNEIKEAFKKLVETGFIDKKISEGKKNITFYNLKKTSNKYYQLYTHI